MNASPLAISDQPRPKTPQLENPLAPELTPPIPPAASDPTVVLSRASQRKASEKDGAHAASAATGAQPGGAAQAVGGSAVGKVTGPLTSLGASAAKAPAAEGSAVGKVTGPLTSLGAGAAKPAAAEGSAVGKVTGPLTSLGAGAGKPAAAEGSAVGKVTGPLNGSGPSPEAARGSAPAPGSDAKSSVDSAKADSAAHSVHSAIARNGVATYGSARAAGVEGGAPPASGNPEPTSTLKKPA